jgi:hypothetical protein
VDPTNPFFSIGDEVADLCDLLTSVYEDPDAGFYAQRVWSNSAALAGTGDPCIPVPAGETFFALTGPLGFAYASPGQGLEVSLTAWSTGPTSSWCVDGVWAGDDFQPNVTNVTSSNPMENGGSLSFTISVPSNVSPPAPDVNNDVPVLYGAEWVESSDCDGGPESIWPVQLGLPPVGQGCNVPSGGAADLCAPYGLVCTPGNPITSCQLPGAATACLPTVGCQDAGSCSDGGSGFYCGP